MFAIYLIQRASFTDRPDKKGIDSILSFDYMGSAEFEFGALPESLKRIRERISEYTYLDIPLNNKVITVFCLSSQKSDMKEILTKLAKNQFHLKEYSCFDAYINPTINEIQWQKDHPHKTDFWWDIDNDFMFWKKSPSFELKFKERIEPLP